MLSPQWLRTFAALIEQGSFTRCAEHLDLTQAAVSQHVQKLEERLGPLLIRRPRQLELTPAGRALLSAMHELPVALRADRIAVMGAGRLLAVGPASDPIVRAALVEVFEHAIELVEIDGRWTAWPRP